MKYDESPTFLITADGKCSNPSKAFKETVVSSSLNRFCIIIDGTQIRKGKQLASLFGIQDEFLPESHKYRLESIEPQKDGRCLACYIKT